MTNEKETAEFKEPHLRMLYKFLGHQGHTSRVGSLDYATKKYEQVFLNNEEEVIEYAKTYNGRRNVFIGRSARNPDGSVRVCRVISFDIDPIREKGEASTDEQHNNALEAGRRVLSRYPNGYLASSGNGCLLLYYVPGGIKNLEEHYRKESVLIRELQELVEDLNVKIDSTNYDEAVIKAIGTMSTKGDESLRRCSRFLTVPVLPYMVPTKLLKHIEDIKEEVKEAAKIVGDPVKRIADAKKFLDKLDSKRKDDYASWLKVGMALKEFGIAGLSLWKEWSQKSEKYEEGICEEKWETFEDTPEVTIATLGYWAKEDTGRDVRRTVQTGSLSYFDKLFQSGSESTDAIHTGIRSLDACISEMPRGEVFTVSARSGFGKSSFACSFAEYHRKLKRKVLYFSTEMQHEYIMHKLVSVSCNIPLEKLISKTFSEEDKGRIRAFEQELLLSSVIICDEFQPSLELVKEEVEKHKPDILIFDHISQVATHWEGVAQFMRGLKALTSNQDCVTLVLSQLNEPGRDKNGNEAVSIRGDVRGSQEIIFLSAVFAYIVNPFEVKGIMQPAEIHIAKNRYGISNVVANVYVNKETGLFTSREGDMKDGTANL